MGSTVAVHIRDYAGKIEFLLNDIYHKPHCSNHNKTSD